jgi:aminotransferase
LKLSDRRAERLKGIKTSGIRRLFSLTQSMPEVINLGIGEPDFSPPRKVLDALKEAVIEGKTHYTPSRGVFGLRDALAKKAMRDYDLTYSPENEILITVGGTEAIAVALLALINKEDEVLVPDPGFVCYEPAVRIAGGTPVSMPVLEDGQFKLSAETLISRITPKSRVIIVNSPNNPTGAVLNYDELAKLAEIAVENDLIVISDEVYEKITYDDARHYCLATFPGMRERTIVINSFSKTYAMTGLRVGFAMGPADLIAPMLLTHQFTVACANGLAQHAAKIAVEGPQSFVAEMVSELDRRRRLICKRLMEIEGFVCTKPKGAFYTFPDIRKFRRTSSDISELLIKEAKVAVIPGSAFGAHGEGFLRLSYSTSYEQIDEAMNRLEKATRKFKES